MKATIGRELSRAIRDADKEIILAGTEMIDAFDFQEGINAISPVPIELEMHEFVRLFLNLRRAVHQKCDLIEAKVELEKASS